MLHIPFSGTRRTVCPEDGRALRGCGGGSGAGRSAAMHMSVVREKVDGAVCFHPSAQREQRAGRAAGRRRLQDGAGGRV